MPLERETKDTLHNITGLVFGPTTFLFLYWLGGFAFPEERSMHLLVMTLVCIAASFFGWLFYIGLLKEFRRNK